MLAFQKTVLGIAVVLLIVMLALIGYTLSYSTATNWPPIVGDCPDYWVDLSGNGEQCFNSHSLGTNKIQACGLPNKDSTTNKVVTVDLSTKTDCEKYDWAYNCGLTWDGITSGVINPCDTTTTDDGNGEPSS